MISFQIFKIILAIFYLEWISSSRVWAACRRAFSFEMIPTSAATASIISPHPVEAEEYRELHVDWF